MSPSQQSDLLIALSLASDLLQTAKEEIEGGNSELALKLLQEANSTLAPFTPDSLQQAINEEYHQD